MNFNLILKTIFLTSLLIVNGLKSNTTYPTDQVDVIAFDAEKLIEYKMRELELLQDYLPYIKGAGKSDLYPILKEKLNIEDKANTDNEIPKEVMTQSKKSKILGTLGFGLNSITKPFRSGTAKAVEALINKAAYKAMYRGSILMLGCFGYWVLWGRQNNPDLPFHKNFFLPITTSFDLLKKIFEKGEYNPNNPSLVRKIDAVFYTVKGWFSKNDPEVNVLKQKIVPIANSWDKAAALIFLFFVNYLF